MMIIRGCRLCTLGDCICDRIVRHNCMQSCITPDDFKPEYRRKYLINIHGIDPNDHTNAKRFVETINNYLLPNSNLNRRYNGDDGYRRFINDLDEAKAKPVAW